MILKRIILVSTLFLIFINQTAFGIDPEVKLRREYYSLWKKRKYKEISPLLRDYYNQIERRADITYWLATSLCRIDKTDEGRGLLGRLIEVERIHPIRRALTDERDQCGSGNRIVDLPSLKLRSGGAFWDPSQGQSEQFVSTSQYEETLSPRLVEIAKPELALSKVRDFLQKEQATVFPMGSHLIAACVRCNKEQEFLKKIGVELETYIQYVSVELGLKEPQNFITIYLVGVGGEKTLEQEYGVRISSTLQLPSSLTGINLVTTNHSTAEDMSIIITAAGSEQWIREKLKHQLFHLLNKNNTSSEPIWIQEGLAALFEESVLDEKKLDLKNKTGAELRKEWKDRPSVRQLLTYGWMNFIDYEFPLSHESRNNMPARATAKYFMLYLLSRGKLKVVMEKIRVIEITQNYELKVPDAESILNAALATKSIDEIDRNFAEWFNSLVDTVKSEK
jgi:hypothetical protein